MTEADIATPDRRGINRERLEGPAHVRCESTGVQTRAATVDLGEGGLSLLCGASFAVGNRIHIDVAGFVIDGIVRHVAVEGVLHRVGVETT